FGAEQVDVEVDRLLQVQRVDAHVVDPTAHPRSSPPSQAVPCAASSRGEDRMSEVVVVGSFRAKPGKEAEAREVFEALVAPTHAESGCILYAFHQGTDDPRRFAFVERWA